MAESGNGCDVRRDVDALDGPRFMRRAAAEDTTALAAKPEDFGEILHGLNNVLVSIVFNAQIMEWKLPSYSRMRRNTHEIQRSAQRAGVLLKRLAGQTVLVQKSPVVRAGEL
jgi:hypothetical protein